MPCIGPSSTRPHAAAPPSDSKLALPILAIDVSLLHRRIFPWHIAAKLLKRHSSRFAKGRRFLLPQILRRAYAPASIGAPFAVIKSNCKRHARSGKCSKRQPAGLRFACLKRSISLISMRHWPQMRMAAIRRDAHSARVVFSAMFRCPAASRTVSKGARVGAVDSRFFIFRE